MAEDGSVEMERQIERLRKLGKVFVSGSAPIVAKAIDKEIAKQIDASEGPDGKPWKPTKAGTAPLQNASEAVTVKAIGKVVLVKVVDVEARHHLGAVKGKVKREIIPTGAIPTPITRAITRVLTGEFHAIMEDEER